MCMCTQSMLMCMKVIIVQVVNQWDALVVYALSCLALVKHSINEIQGPLQLTLFWACVVAVPWIANVQGHLFVDAVHVRSLILDCVQIWTAQPMLVPPALNRQAQPG